VQPVLLIFNKTITKAYLNKNKALFHTKNSFLENVRKIEEIVVNFRRNKGKKEKSVLLRAKNALIKEY
jgi:ABC-type microcin C transport system permease subunit YejB